MNASCIYHGSCESGACKKEEGEDVGVCVEGINCSGKYGDCKNCIKEYDISEYPKGNGSACPQLAINCSNGEEGCETNGSCNSSAKNPNASCSPGNICVDNKCMECNSSMTNPNGINEETNKTNAGCNIGDICVVNKCLKCSDIPVIKYNKGGNLDIHRELCDQYKEYCVVGDIIPTTKEYNVCKNRTCLNYKPTHDHKKCSDVTLKDNQPWYDPCETYYYNNPDIEYTDIKNKYKPLCFTDSKDIDKCTDKKDEKILYCKI